MATPFYSEAKETHDGKVRIQVSDATSQYGMFVLPRDHALLLAIKIIIASSGLSVGETILALVGHDRPESLSRIPAAPPVVSGAQQYIEPPPQARPAP